MASAQQHLSTPGPAAPQSPRPTPHPHVPRLDTRKIVSLGQISLPDSVRAATSSRSAQYSSSISAPHTPHSRNDLSSSQHAPYSARSMASHVAAPNHPSLLSVIKQSAPRTGRRASVDRGTPAAATANSLTDQHQHPHPPSSSHPTSSPRSYRPAQKEPSVLREMRVKSQRARSGKPLDSSDEESGGENDAAKREGGGQEKANAGNRNNDNCGPIPAQGQHHEPLLPRQSTAHVADIFRAEGQLIREVLLNLSEHNMEWFKKEFAANDGRTTGPQFIRLLSDMFVNPELGLATDAASGPAEKKIVGYGLRQRDAKNLFAEAFATIGPLDHSSVSSRGSLMPGGIDKTSMNPNASGSSGVFGNVTSLQLPSPSSRGKRASIVPNVGLIHHGASSSSVLNLSLPPPIVVPPVLPSPASASLLFSSVFNTETDDDGERRVSVDVTRRRQATVSLSTSQEMSDEKRQAKIAQKASALFSAIDLKDTGTISWHDFTNYIVDAFLYTEFEKEDSVRPYLPTTKVNTSCNRDIDRIFNISEHGPHGSIIITERDTHSFKICTPSSFSELHSMRPSKWKEVHGHQGSVLAVDHLAELGYLATSSTDCTINFWDTDNYKLCQRLPVPVPQVTMEWFSAKSDKSYKSVSGVDPNQAKEYGVLFTGGIVNPKTPGGKATIYGWNPISFKNVCEMSLHTDTILDLLSIPTLHTLVSCGMDSTINLWDLHTQQHKKTLTGHSKGVMDIDYSPDHRILASAGFDHDVLVWNPHVENIICRLMGHNAALIGVKISERSPEILSASRDGVIKVWDIRNFKCSQTIYCETSSDLTDFTYYEGDTYGCLLVASKGTLHLFENEPDENPKITDVRSTVGIVFQASTCSFITAAGRTIKIWDARNGTLIKDYSDFFLDEELKRNRAKVELTAIALDWSEKKLVIGTSTGSMSIWLLGSMTKLYTMYPHAGEVTCISCLAQREMIISTSRDGTTKVQSHEEGREPHLVASVSHVVAVRRLVEVAKNAALNKPSKRMSTRQKRKSANDAVAMMLMMGVHSPIKRLSSTAGSADPGKDRDQPRDSVIATLSPSSDKNAGMWEVTLLSVSSFLGQFATVSHEPIILLWDVFAPSHTRPLGSCFGHKFRISDIAFVTPHPALVSGDAGGEIIIWALYPTVRPHRKILSFDNIGRKFRDSPCAVTSLSWSQPDGFLVVGDSEGRLKCWDISAALNARGYEKMQRARLGSQQFSPEQFASAVKQANTSRSGKVESSSRASVSEDEESSWDGDSSESGSDSSSYSSRSDMEAGEGGEGMGAGGGAERKTSRSSRRNDESPIEGDIGDDAAVESQTFLTGTTQTTKLEASSHPKMKLEQELKPSPTVLRQWDAHTESIEMVDVVVCPYLHIKAYGHHHGRHGHHGHHGHHRHQHRHHHKHHQTQHRGHHVPELDESHQREREIPPNVNETDPSSRYVHNAHALIVSVSLDLTVKLWGLDGQLVGILQQGAVQGSAFAREEAGRTWKVDVDEKNRSNKYDHYGPSAAFVVSSSNERRKSRLSTLMGGKNPYKM